MLGYQGVTWKMRGVLGGRVGESESIMGMGRAALLLNRTTEEMYIKESTILFQK